MKRFFLISGLIIGLFASSLAGGKAKTTTIQGKVTDQLGEPLVGAKIEIIGSEHSIYTDFEGEFSMENIPLDVKEITVSHIAFKKKQLNLKLNEVKDQLHLKLSSK